jgi:lipid-A-disaccharide synthase
MLAGPAKWRLDLLVVAGEASGDAMAAPVLEQLRIAHSDELHCAGVGGPALRAAGLRTLIPTERLSAMGLADVFAQAASVARAAARLVALAVARRPRAALLVGYSDFNARLGPQLKRLGTRVLWYGAPQVWAWRAGRANAIARACDRMAVILPFERELWRRHGVDAHYVGHPALESVRPSAAHERAELVSELALESEATRIALLPGSRPGELTRHLPAMLGAVRALSSQRKIDARLLLAPSLAIAQREWAKQSARAMHIDCVERPATQVLGAFDIAICSSGTATLECALARVPPLIVYRTDWASALIAKRLLRVDSVGLPNILLSEAVFPELLQQSVNPDEIARHAARLVDDRAGYVRHCERVRQAVSVGAPVTQTPSQAVAALIEPWLA